MADTKVCRKCNKEKPLHNFPARSGQCSACYAVATRLRYKNNPEYRRKQKEWSKISHLHLKAKIIDAYGGQCACCGEKEPRFLTIDHTRGDGAANRKSGEGSGGSLYLNLQRRGFPKDGYQLLCFNCNCSKRQFGICPHKDTARHLVSVDS